MTPREGFVLLVDPPVAALSCVIAAISDCGVCPQATASALQGAYIHTHTNTPLPSLTSPKWTHQRDLISIHRVAVVGQIFNLKHNSSIGDIFSLSQRFGCFVRVALVPQSLCQPPQNSHVVAVEYLMPSALPCRCLWMPRLSRSGGRVAFTILSSLFKLSV